VTTATMKVWSAAVAIRRLARQRGRGPPRAQPAPPSPRSGVSVRRSIDPPPRPVPQSTTANPPAAEQNLLMPHPLRHARSSNVVHQHGGSHGIANGSPAGTQLLCMPCLGAFFPVGRCWGRQCLERQPAVPSASGITSISPHKAVGQHIPPSSRSGRLYRAVYSRDCHER
jgi:hypothetical protein